MARVVVLLAGLVCALCAAPALAQTVDPCVAIADPYDRVPIDTGEDIECDPGCENDGIFTVAETLLDESNSLAPDSTVVTFAEDTLRELANDTLSDGGSFDPDVDVTEYGSVGTSLNLGLITRRRQSDLQRQTADDVVWVRHRTGVRARAGQGRNIAIGSTGAFVRVGLRAGASARITTERPYRKDDAGDAVLDVLRTSLRAGGVRERNPFDAGSWEDCVPGEKVTIEAPGNIRFNYGVGWGVSEELEDWVTVGAAASVDRTRMVSGNIVRTVECLAPGQVRIALRQKQQRYKDLALNAFAGLQFDDGEIVEGLDLPDGIGFVSELAEAGVDEVTDEAQEILSARYTLRYWNTEPAYGGLPELEVANGTFRLNSRTGRQAFEDAMRGDFDTALDTTRCSGDSNPVVFRSQEESFNREGVFRSLRVAKHEIRSSFATGDGTRIFRGPEGVRRQDIADLDIERSRLLGSEGELHCEVVIEQIQETGDKKVWVECGGSVEEAFTTKGEFADLLVGAQALASHDQAAQESLGRVFASQPDGKVGYLPTWLAGAAGVGASIATGNPAPMLLIAAGPGFNDHWGKTQAQMELRLNEQGIENVLSAGSEGLWKALAMPRVEPPLWGDTANHPTFELASANNCTVHDNNNRGSSSGVCDDIPWDVKIQLDEYERYRDLIAQAETIKDQDDKVEKARIARDVLASFKLPHLLMIGQAYDYTGIIAMGVLARAEGRDMSVSLSADGGDMFWEWTEDMAD